MLFPTQKKISKKEINSLPFISFNGQICLCDNEKKINDAAKELKKEKIIGFDTETKPSFKKGEYYSPSLLQLASAKTVYLIHLKKSPITSPIIKIFENKNIIKTGVAIQRDILDLKKVTSFNSQNFIELSEIAKKNGVENLGLRSLTALFFGSKLSKKEQVSNWARSKLTDSQIKYAATDAWISRELYVLFLNIGLISKQ